MRKVHIVIAFWLLLLVSACYHRYPGYWRDLQPVTKGTCPDIAGMYHDRGESGDSPSRHASFDRLLFYKTGDVTPHVTMVQISQPGQDEIEMSSWDSNELVRRKQFSQSTKEFLCTPQGIEIPLGRRGWSAEGLGWADERHKAYLSKSKDGYLVVKHFRYLYGCCAYFPFLLPETRWFKFSSRADKP